MWINVQSESGKQKFPHFKYFHFQSTYNKQIRCPKQEREKMRIQAHSQYNIICVLDGTRKTIKNNKNYNDVLI